MLFVSKCSHCICCGKYCIGSQQSCEKENQRSCLTHFIVKCRLTPRSHLNDVGNTDHTQSIFNFWTLKAVCFVLWWLVILPVLPFLSCCVPSGVFLGAFAKSLLLAMSMFTGQGVVGFTQRSRRQWPHYSIHHVCASPYSPRAFVVFHFLFLLLFL